MPFVFEKTPRIYQPQLHDSSGQSYTENVNMVYFVNQFWTVCFLQGQVGATFCWFANTLTIKFLRVKTSVKN